MSLWKGMCGRSLCVHTYSLCLAFFVCATLCGHVCHSFSFTNDSMVVGWSIIGLGTNCCYAFYSHSLEHEAEFRQSKLGLYLSPLMVLKIYVYGISRNVCLDVSFISVLFECQHNGCVP
jgi:hypothetical protein